MSLALKRAFLALLLGILPLQSIAATLVPLLCAPHEAQHHEAASDHPGHAMNVGDPGHHHPGGAAAHGHDGQTQSHDGQGHLCCHHFSAVPAFVVPVVPADFRVYLLTELQPSQLHIPDLPQRPPRA